MATLIATTSFLPLVLPWVPGAPQMAVRAEIVRAAIRLCDEAKVWREEPDAVDVVAATHTYTIPLVTGANAVQIDEVYYDSTLLDPRTPHVLRRCYQDWLTVEGVPRYYTQEDPDTIRVVPIPRTVDALVDGLTFRVVYKPTMASTTVPSFLYNQYGFTVAAGALRSLLSMRGRTWADPQLAQHYALEFDRGVQAAKADASKAFSTAQLQAWRKFV